MALSLDGHLPPVNEQGFLLDASLWNEQVALELARREAIQLTEAHWSILHFIRQYHQQYKHLPNARMFVTALRKQFGEEVGNSRYLQNLFPQGPLKYACKLAGLPKPPNCL
jgi:tRNA 2-thiouridine synthesizing protein E